MSEWVRTSMLSIVHDIQREIADVDVSWDTWDNYIAVQVFRGHSGPMVRKVFDLETFAVHKDRLARIYISQWQKWYGR